MDTKPIQQIEIADGPISKNDESGVLPTQDVERLAAALAYQSGEKSEVASKALVRMPSP